MPKIPAIETESAPFDTDSEFPKVIGVVGSRRRNLEDDFESMRDAFLGVYCKGDKIVSGGAPKGGDRFAERIARDMGITITIHFADWNGPAKLKAGFVRNTLIAEDCDLLLAMPAEDRTGGTEDTIKKVARLGKKIILVGVEDE